MKEIEITKQNNQAIATDRYQLKMAAGFIEHDLNDKAIYEIMLRKLPKGYGYYVVNGVEQAIEYILAGELTRSDIAYLRESSEFSEGQLSILKSIRFDGDIYAINEGTPVGANTPIMVFEATRAQARMIETIALNSIKYSTAVATKASKIVHAAMGIPIAEFGLRDAPGVEAGILASRAAYLAGFAATSNDAAGKEYGIPVTGTMAHDWVMTFGVDGERDAFRAYYKSYPNKSSFLIDTWDVKRGAMNAAIVAKEMEKTGHKLLSVRLDSGNLLELSSMVREIFNTVGLDYVKILATNELDEYKLVSLHNDGGELDGAGVGVNIVKAVGADTDASFKMVEDRSGIKMKYSSGKVGIPGHKQVWRHLDQDGNYLFDELKLRGEIGEGKHLLELKVKGGERMVTPKSLIETRAFCLSEITKLPKECLTIPEAKPYKTILSKQLELARDGEVARIIQSINESDTYNLYAEIGPQQEDFV